MRFFRFGRRPTSEDTTTVRDIETAEEQPELRSVELVYEVAKDRAKAQDTQIAGLDTKASFVLTAASLIVGGSLTILQRVLPPQASPSTTVMLYFGAMVAAFLFFAIVHTVIDAYYPQPYSQAPDPQHLAQTYLYDDPTEVKGLIVVAMGQAITDNSTLIEAKAAGVQRALKFLRAEAAWLVIWLSVVLFTLIT